MQKIMELPASTILEHGESQLWEEERQRCKEQEKPRWECKGEIDVAEKEVERKWGELKWKGAKKAEKRIHSVEQWGNQEDPADQYMEKKEEDTFSERGGIEEEASYLWYFDGSNLWKWKLRRILSVKRKVKVKKED